MNYMFTKDDLYEIPNERKELYARVIDSHTVIHEVGMRMHFLEDHFPPNQLEMALRWLIANDLVGVKFVRWYDVECHKSNLEMHAKLLQVVNNSELERPVAGRNFKV